MSVLLMIALAVIPIGAALSWSAHTWAPATAYTVIWDLAFIGGISLAGAGVLAALVVTFTF